MPPLLRPATPTDAAFAAPLIQATAGQIGYALTGEGDGGDAARVIAAFFRQPDNRLSFGHTLILEEGGSPVGLAVAYPGNEARRLDEPFRARLRALGLPDRIDPEASPGELYLDTLAVVPSARDRGLGGLLLGACLAHAAALGLPRLGLLTVPGGAAERLYRRHGFASGGVRQVAGEDYVHLVRPV
ncbi:GNAT family N-acetyltransferase [Deinococcus hopiensis]|nr:GNAT family N-acetyltransferase [Deinococcus hopiensis]